MAYLHPDKQDALVRVLVKGKARTSLTAPPKPSPRPTPGPGLIAALAADMLASRQVQR